MHTADARHDNPRLARKLSHLYTLRGGPSVDLTIRPPYLDLLRRLGDPHLKLPPVIHVAGTNGKGSTVAMLRAALGAAGHGVHVYTSPHLVRFNERIVVAGAEISDAALEDLLDEVLAANADGALTFFEITTAAALAAFARHPADFVLLETGLGGRLDCTNVVPAPLATAITTIGHDHHEFLGETLAAIAGEKAGIMKPGCPCAVGPIPDPAARDVILARAAALGVPVAMGGRDWQVRMADGGLVFEMGGARASWPLPNLAGAHQAANAGVVLAVIAQMARHGVKLDPAAVAAGLTGAVWPARLQRLEDGTLLRFLPPGSALWIDGGHNEDAARALARQADLWRAETGLPLHLVVGMMGTKRAADFFKHLAPCAALVVTTDISGLDAKGWPAASLADLAREAGAAEVQSGEDLVSALKFSGASGRPSLTLVCGSLYLAGEALRLHRVTGVTGHNRRT